MMITPLQDAHHSIIDDAEIIVDYNRQQLMPGWIPRRLGQSISLHFHFLYVGNVANNDSFPNSQQEGGSVVKKSQDNFVLEDEKDHLELPCRHPPSHHFYAYFEMLSYLIVFTLYCSCAF